MATNKLDKQRRLGYQALEAREMMHGESIGPLPEVDVRQINEPALVASASPQHSSQESSLRALAIDARLEGNKIRRDTLPLDVFDLYGVLPKLSSNPSAPATIYLDFNGHSEAVWGAYSDIEVPKFDIDHDLNGYSAAENLMMQNVWARVAEDFAPFNINVTTVDPGSFENGEALRIAIGGYWHDWYGEAAGGLGYRNAFTSDVSNVAFVWSGSKNYWAEAYGEEARLSQWIADAASHEAGHSLGLDHQSKFRERNGIYVKSEEYRKGDAWKGPIMGSTSYSDRSTWARGTVGDGGTTPPLIQADMAVLSNSTNGFGYRADDHGETLRNATVLSRDNVNVSGIIEQTSDVDVFRFDTNGGQITIDLNVARLGANLDAKIELWGSAPQVSTRTISKVSIISSDLLNTPRLLASSDPADALDASITKNVAAGTYYVKVLSHGEYGDVGQYTIGGEMNLQQIIKNPINGADFLAWQRGFGTFDARKTEGDGDNDLDVDRNDLNLWQSQFGKTATVVFAASSPIVETVPAIAPKSDFLMKETAAFISTPEESAESQFLANPILGPADVGRGVSLSAHRQESLGARILTEHRDERFQGAWHAVPGQNHEIAGNDFASAKESLSSRATQPVDAAFALLAVDEEFAGLRFASAL